MVPIINDVMVIVMMCTQEVIQLHSRLKRKADQVDKLQLILTENGLECKTTGSKKRNHPSDLQSNLKENILIAAPSQKY